MQTDDGGLRLSGKEQAAEDADADLYSQTHSFYQQPFSLQLMQFVNSASATSVSSMSSATTPPIPPPPQSAGASLQQQHCQPTTAQPATSAAAVTTYQQQQQQQQQQQPYSQHVPQQPQQKLRPQQMTSASAVSLNANVNVNASTAAAYKRQQQKLRRLRELHSLALEGGDTARGYCSCDEQWTSTSPPAAVSPTLSSNEGHEKTSDGSESNETAAPTTSAETAAEMAGERRLTGNAYRQINVATGRGRLAVGGNDGNAGGHSRARQQQKHTNNSNSSHIDGVGSIWTGTRANEVAKAAAAVVAAKAAMAGGVRVDSRPVPAARLKQQHHVRFSDEKNFSD